METKKQPEFGFINYTQKQGIAKMAQEKGITLIALIIMIILIIILSAVTLKGITGKEGLIATSTKVAGEYTVKQGQEQLELLLQSIILEDAVAGKTTTINSIAEKMEKEDWIASAVAGEKDIVITTTDGYIYTLYYDETTGKQEIDFSGQGVASLPTLNASYDKIKGTITVNANSEDGIKKIELIFKNQVIQTVETNNAVFEVKESGEYQVKVTANSGKTKSTWVRVAGTVTAPTIAITSSNEIENGWYGKDKKAVEVTISTNNETVSGIYYKTNTETGYMYAEGKEAKVTISNSGRTIIYAYTVDKVGNESEIANKEIKYDSRAPEIGNIGVASGTIGLNGWYTTDVELALRNVTDENSGIAGYYYWEGASEVTEEQKTFVGSIDRTVTVISEGEKVLSFEAKDKAGNKSNKKTITVRKDSVGPNSFEPRIVEGSIGTNGFTVVAGTSDITSGVSHYNFYIKLGNETIRELKNDTTGNFIVTGLETSKTYNITVEAVDNAGDISLGTGITCSTKGVVTTPIISISPTTPNGDNGWYKNGDIVVTISDGETDSTKSGVTEIVYTLNGTATTVNGRSSQVTINTDGTHTIKAYATDGSTNSSETTTYTIKRDVTDPSTATLSTPTNVTETGMTVTGAASDSTSGIATYKFQASTSNTFASIAKESTAQASDTYTFSGLTGGTTYYLRVIVTDNAGRTKTSGTVTQSTVTAGKPPEELGKTEYAGKYVNYVPAVSNYSVNSTYSGSTSNPTFSANNSMKWRIWGVEGNKLLLISETLAGNITLSGANGYNNAVKILNDACSTAFGNSSTYGSGAITVRSINQDDIDKVTNMTEESQRKAVYSTYGEKQTYTSNTNWPKIYGYEPGKSGTTANLDRSKQYNNTWVTGTTSASFTAKRTYYNYSITNYATQTIYDALLTNPVASSTTGSDSHTTYWVASRCVHINELYANFSVFCVTDGEVDSNYLCTTGDYTDSNTFAVRPIVEINLDLVSIGTTGSGTASAPYSMVKK